MLLSTLAHELSHALAAMMLGGEVESLRLWADASGVAVHSGTYGATSRATIAAAGPLGPPLFAAAALEPEPVGPSPVDAALDEINPDDLSPREALEALYRLKGLSKKP